MEKSQPRVSRPVSRISGQTPHPRASTGGGRLYRGERDPKMCKGQATEPGRTRSRRAVTSEAGGRSTRYASAGVPARKTETAFRLKNRLIDATYAGTKAGVHLRQGSADQDGSAVSTCEALNATTLCVVDRCLSTSAAKSLSPLRWNDLGVWEEKETISRERVSSLFGGSYGGAMTKKCICKERHSTEGFSNFSGCDMTPSSPVKSRITGRSND